MRRLVLGRAASRDLNDILRYVASRANDPRYGHSVADLLLAQCEKLARLPGTLGRPRSDLQPGLRSFPFQGYVIFFRYVGDDVLQVVNVLHARRDIDDSDIGETNEP